MAAPRRSPPSRGAPCQGPKGHPQAAALGASTSLPDAGTAMPLREAGAARHGRGQDRAGRGHRGSHWRGRGKASGGHRGSHDGPLLPPRGAGRGTAPTVSRTNNAG